MADNLPEKIKNKVGHILTQVVSDIKPYFMSNNDVNHYHDLYNFAASYLIMVVVIWIMHVLLLLFRTRGKDMKRSFRKTLEGISETCVTIVVVLIDKLIS
ncbi:hypothetical protein OROMI_025299 [Orobanche minor]